MILYLTRSILDTKITVWWIDNFSKCYAVAMQGVASGAFSDCNWTGQAFKSYVGPEVDIKIRNRLAMPDDIFTHYSIATVRRSLISSFAERKWFYLRNSLVKRFNVNNIPLKPVLNAESNPRLHAVLAESRDGLGQFHPNAILPQNVGSNRGLLKILKMMSDDRKNNDDRFHFLTADCNIFMRIMKVCAKTYIVLPMSTCINNENTMLVSQHRINICLFVCTSSCTTHPALANQCASGYVFNSGPGIVTSKHAPSCGHTGDHEFLLRCSTRSSVMLISIPRLDCQALLDSLPMSA